MSRHIVRKHGRRPVLLLNQAHEAAEFYRLGASCKTVAKRYGVSECAVRYALKRVGQPTRSLSQATAIGNRLKNKRRIASVFDLAA